MYSFPQHQVFLEGLSETPLNMAQVAEDTPVLSEATRDIGLAAHKKLRSAAYESCDHVCNNCQRCKQYRKLRRRRSNSWHGKTTHEPRSSDIAQPGGFRRHYVQKSPTSLFQPRAYATQTDFVDLLIEADLYFGFGVDASIADTDGSHGKLAGAEAKSGQWSTLLMSGLRLLQCLPPEIVGVLMQPPSEKKLLREARRLG